jgi:poly(3-hydroxybutyrate) depolymerase
MMMQRALTMTGAMSLSLTVGLFSVAGCSGGGSSTTGSGSPGAAGTSGSPGAAGTSGGVGTAGAGTASGTAGTGDQTGAAGTGSEAGATGAGTAGTSGGDAGSSAGTGGGQAGAGAAGSGAAGTSATGAGGATGAAGTSGARPSGPSAGCTAAVPNEPLGTSVLQMIDVTGMAQEYVAGYTHRKYCTTIPKNYNPTQPYPVVFYGPGCGATACEGDSFTGRSDIFLVQAIAGADAKGANIVPLNGSPGCFQAGKESTVDSPEGPYFDQVMAQVEAKYCVDKGRVFAAGTSSGAWLSNYLACARGNVIRGSASDSGGIQFNRPTCTGGVGVMELPGDSTEIKDSKGNEIGSGFARDMFIQLNGCSTTPTMMTFGDATKSVSCSVYGGCASPVVWCPAAGGSHQAGNNYLSPSGWAFWSTLK